MSSLKEYKIFCHFCGIGEKTIKAHSIEEARELVEKDAFIQFDEIVRLTKPCWVDPNMSMQVNETEKQNHHSKDYKNWGAE